MKLYLCLFASFLSASSVRASRDTSHHAGHPKAEFTKRSLKRKEQKNRLLDMYLDENEQFAQCDQALMDCLPLSNCDQCFRVLYDDLIDWGTVSPDTECPRVLDTLFNKGYCGGLQTDEKASDAFCRAFHACAVNDEAYADDDLADDVFYDGNSREKIVCSNLTKCEWPGMHPSFFGDGVCQDYDCYNTEICGWDGGDCCQDTCSNADKNYATCGMDGYICRDPTSTSCDPYLVKNCELPNVDPESDDEVIACDLDEAVYRIIMYDSFGDGWDATRMTITPSERPNSIVFNGGLVSGSQGTSYICLAKTPTCYNIQVTGGAWGNEVSWEVKPLTEGHPALAGGAAPMNCVFSVAGSACENTCTGKPNVHPNVDPEYKEFKDMYNCIEDYCFIQIDTCEQDLTCSTCMAEDAPQFCYGNEQFVALIDCTMCHCTDRKESLFCKEKLNPAKPPPPDPKRETKPKTGARSCSPSETMDGSDALLTFGSCTDFDEVGMMVTNFDQDHFGPLDTFESCSHSFQNNVNHGGHTALNCMQILVNAMDYGMMDDDAEDNDVPVEAIAELASLIYHDAENFCDCTMKASETCPMCDKFIHFKTLLYESLDACQSLDEIDCAAWSEFYGPCKNNMGNVFSSIDFSDDKQCQYVAAGCGGAGPFPAFRRLDCEREVTSTAWDFYKSYSRGCHKEDNGGKKPPVPASSATNTNVIPVRPSSNYRPVTPATPKPTSNSTYTTPSPTPQPTPKPYVPWDDRGGSKPTVPYINLWDDDDYSGSDSQPKKKSHFFRNFVFVCLLAGGCYWVYKNRSESFNFVHQYTMNRNRNYASGESGMYGGNYTGLSTMEGSTSFEPPSLPPTPSAIDGNMT